MAMRIEDVIVQARCERAELETWIAERWVLPIRDERGYVFGEADVARVRLISDLRHQMDIETETLPVVLSLIDQVYELRRRLQQMASAAAALPPSERSAFLHRLGFDEDAP